MEMTPLFQFISDVGFPIAIAVVGGLFALNALKYVFTGAVEYLDRIGSDIDDINADVFAAQKHVIDVDDSIMELIEQSEDNRS